MRVLAAGADKAGIVAGICRALAEHRVNIADLSSKSAPGEGGSPHYELTMTVEVPERLDLTKLRTALDRAAEQLRIDVDLQKL
jgi:predicted amino acid-binding ACT domain protein